VKHDAELDGPVRVSTSKPVMPRIKGERVERYYED
jgi:hypothetical protein